MRPQQFFFHGGLTVALLHQRGENDARNEARPQTKSEAIH